MRNANTKTKKLNLETIKIDSFVTRKDSHAVKGGFSAGTRCSGQIACTTGPTDLSFMATVCFNDCTY